MRYLAMGIDPGKDGGIDIIEGSQVLFRSPMPMIVPETKKGTRKYDHAEVKRRLLPFVADRDAGKIEIVAGVEVSWPIPHDKDLRAIEWDRIGKDLCECTVQAKDIANEEARERFLYDRAIGIVRPRFIKAIKGLEAPIRAFQQGGGVEMWFAHLAWAGIPVIGLTPATWQAEMFRGISGSDSKQKALIVVSRLFPGVDWRATERCRVAHGGMVDAAAIAECTRRTFWPDRSKDVF